MYILNDNNNIQLEYSIAEHSLIIHNIIENKLFFFLSYYLVGYTINDQYYRKPQ